jgi:hypothetical protein
MANGTFDSSCTYLDLQRLYFCYVQRVEAINRFFLYIGGISDRHCLNLVLDVTKLYEIFIKLYTFICHCLSSSQK